MEKESENYGLSFTLNKGFDILVTHSPPFGIGDSTDACHTGFKAFYPFLINISQGICSMAICISITAGLNEPLIIMAPTIVDAYQYHIMDI